MKKHNQENQDFYGLPFLFRGRHSEGNLSPEQRLKCDDEDRRSIQKYYIPVNLEAKEFVRTTKAEKTKQEFDDLIKEWVSAIKYKSLESQQINHPAFLRLIAIGDKVKPFIFEEFSKRPFVAWLKALPAIVGQDVASEANSFPEAIKLWLDWAKENDYLPK